MKVLVTGSSGLIGSRLVPFLKENGHEVITLVRGRSTLLPDEMVWNPERGVISPERLEGIDAVVHLAGENIADSRWTSEKKKRILDSRVISTRLLCRALSSLKNPPRVLVSASATGYYGNRGDEVLTERSSRGKGFLADVCEKWEQATHEAGEKGIRVVNLRTGIVLSAAGGALKQMLPPFELGLGGTIGSGKQYMSWIAIDDLIRIIDFALHKEALRGPVNAVSPNPVTNKVFTKTLAHLLHRPALMWIPAFMARWLFGEMADEMLLSSARVEPRVLQENGFSFLYPTLEQALRFILNKPLT